MAASSEKFAMTVPGRLVYCHTLIAPESFRGGMSRYNTTVLLPRDHPDLAALRRALATVVAAAFPGRDPKMVAIPLKDGNVLAAKALEEGRDHSFFKGCMVLSCHSNETKSDGTPMNPPGLVALVGGKMTAFDTDRRAAGTYFYSGVNGIVHGMFGSYEGMGGGVSAYLTRVLSLNTGERIQVGASHEEAFGPASRYADFVGQAVPFDPLGDEVPF